MPASGVVGQGASEDVVVVAESCPVLIDVTSRLLCASGDDATKLENEMAGNKMCVKCILVCMKKERINGYPSFAQQNGDRPGEYKESAEKGGKQNER